LAELVVILDLIFCELRDPRDEDEFIQFFKIEDHYPKQIRDMAVIEVIKIHPAIGIARLGNSPTEFFIGPEKAGTHPRPTGGYKDAHGRIKRQAARFRLFGYDKHGNLVGEITKKEAHITWTVHLANKKAAWNQFDGLNPNTPLRNAPIANRDSLIIDPGPRSLSGPNKVAHFDTGTFLGGVVPLGEIRTESQGRLVVLGGFGHSASPTNAPLTTFANNDEWHDDVSDGPVTATVTLNGSGDTFQAVGAWVICPPPKFAPPIDTIITLYDTLLQVAVDKLGLQLPAQPSFTKDIYPLFQRAINVKWVSGMVTSQHAHATLSAITPPPASASARLAIFNKLRDPALPPDQDAGDADMPMIWSDYYTAGKNQPLTRIQYDTMRKWKDGNFINDWSGSPKPSRRITPEGLDRAALESCVGAAFYPGIEASWLLRDTYKFSEPFRLDAASLEPGDITKQMAVPWQADFYDCTQDGDYAWWPAQRPDDVFPEQGGPQVPWIRQHINSPTDMVGKWHELGFVVKKGSKYLETERNP
jgi:L-Lysine epsilon oxidase N-terminal/L-lysine epsilon oxidase C-terminal domain